MRVTKIKYNIFDNAVDSLAGFLFCFDYVIKGHESFYKLSAVSMGMYIDLSFLFFVDNIPSKSIYKKNNPKRTKSFDTCFKDTNDFLKNSSDCRTYYEEKLKFIRNIYLNSKHFKPQIDINKYIEFVQEVILIMDGLHADFETSVYTALKQKYYDKIDISLYMKLLNNYDFIKNDVVKHIAQETGASWYEVKDGNINEIDDVYKCIHCDYEPESLIYNHKTGQYQCQHCGNEEQAVICNWCHERRPLSYDLNFIEGEYGDKTFWCYNCYDYEMENF